MLLWTLWQYGSVVSEFCDHADEDMWLQVEARLFQLMERGNAVGMPVSEPVGSGTGLFALRARAGTKQGRLFYFFMSGGKIVFVHSVALKKRRTFEAADIDLAKRRKREIEAADDMRRILTEFVVKPNDRQTH